MICRFNVLSFLILLTAFTYGYPENVCRQLSPKTMQLLEQVIGEIYHLNTQEIQEIVQQDFGQIPDITADELRDKMAQNPDALIINVLSEKWYTDCHIEGSINIPLNTLIYVMDQYERDREIVVYCALYECDASEKAYVLLRSMGFEHVVDYRGGIKEWFQLGYPVIGLCASTYLHDRSCNRLAHAALCSFDFDFRSVLKRTMKLSQIPA